jgi:hypothetical protein
MEQFKDQKEIKKTLKIMNNNLKPMMNDINKLQFIYFMKNFLNTYNEIAPIKFNEYDFLEPFEDYKETTKTKMIVFIDDLRNKNEITFPEEFLNALKNIFNIDNF